MDIAAVLQLPRVPFANRKALPDSSGLYFALVNGAEVAYVGAARASIRRRWAAHHRSYRLQRLGSVEIAYLLMDASELPDAERAAIIEMQPCLNVFHVKGSYERERRYFAEQLAGLKRPKRGPKPKPTP